MYVTFPMNYVAAVVVVIIW